MQLTDIRDNPGARVKRRRVGRGIGSGRGKTSSRGGKGQTARSGVSIHGFEGGQMPLHRRLPKRGFTPYRRKKYAEITLGKLQAALDAGRIDAKNLLTGQILKEAGLVSRLMDGIRVIGGGGELKVPLKLAVLGISGPALQALQALGGEIVQTPSQDLLLGS